MKVLLISLALVCVMSVCQAQVQTGTIDCGGSPTWLKDDGTTGGIGKKQRVVDVKFQVKYKKAPKVFVTISRLDIDEKLNHRVWHQLNSVTTTGFQAACITWYDTHIYDMQLNWISINDGGVC